MKIAMDVYLLGCLICVLLESFLGKNTELANVLRAVFLFAKQKVASGNIPLRILLRPAHLSKDFQVVDLFVVRTVT